MKIILAGPFATDPFRTALQAPFTGAPPGPIQTPIGPLALELLRAGHDVYAITIDQTIQQPVRVKHGRLTLIYVPQRASARLRTLDFFETEIRFVAEEIERIQPDLVHAHWTYEYAEAAVRGQAAHVVTMHDVPIEVAWIFKNAYRFLRLLLAFRVLVRAKCVTAVAPSMAGWARFHGYFGEVSIIPNGVEVPAFEHREPDAAVQPPIIATIGDISGRKNIRTGIAAHKLVRRAHPNAELHLFGPGLDEAYVGGAEGVIGHGATPHSDLMKFLSERATLLSHPSYWEACPVIVIEAMARGLPVVAGRQVVGSRFVVGDQLSDLLVDVGDPEALANGILGLLDNSAAYASAVSRSRQRAEEAFSAPVAASRYLSVYRQALQIQSRDRASLEPE